MSVITQPKQCWIDLESFVSNEWIPVSFKPIKKFTIVKKKLDNLELPQVPISFLEHIATFKKLLYKAKNQQRVTKFYQHLDTVKRKVYFPNQIVQLSFCLETFRNEHKLENKSTMCVDQETTKTLLKLLNDIIEYFDKFLNCLEMAS